MQQENTIAIRAEAGTTGPLLRVEGMLSISTAGTLQAALLAQLAPQSFARLDLSALTGADLSGLQLLCSARQTWRRSGGGLSFTGVPEWLETLARQAGCEWLTPAIEEGER